MDSISITLEQMYAAQANSPNTELAGDLDTTSREITVVDASVLPAVPFLLTIGYDTATSETVLVTAAEENTLTVTRGVDGPAQIWVAGVKCARIFTAKDLNDIQINIGTIKTALEEAQGDLSEMESEKADQIIISGVEESSTAANSYSVGQYLILSGVLYRVTAAIAAGDTITDSGSGANVAAATVGGELSGLRNTLMQLETETETVENGLAIIVEGNSCVSGASQGQYVYLKDSTITGYDDGLYTAAQAIPADTVIDGTYLTAVSGGGLNDLKSALPKLTVSNHSSNWGTEVLAQDTFGYAKTSISVKKNHAYIVNASWRDQGGDGTGNARREFALSTSSSTYTEPSGANNKYKFIDYFGANWGFSSKNFTFIWPYNDTVLYLWARSGLPSSHKMDGWYLIMEI